MSFRKKPAARKIAYRNWQQKYTGAEQLIQMLRNTLHENQALTEEKGKVLAQEMEKVKEYMANYDALHERNLSLERELEAGAKENDRLQSQLQGGETGKDHLEGQIQSLKTLLEDGVAKEAVTNDEKEQALLQMQALSQQVQALEAENKMLQMANGPMAIRGQDPGESEVLETTSTATQTDAGQKAQAERLEMLRAQLEEYVVILKSEYLKQHHQIEGVKGSVREMQAQLMNKHLGGRKPPEQMKFPGDRGLANRRGKANPEQPEIRSPEKGPVGWKPTALQEEVLPALLECWSKKWDQWFESRAKEMSHLKQQLGDCCKPQVEKGITVPNQRSQVEATLLEVGMAGKEEQASSRRETNNLVCWECTQERQGTRRHKPEMNLKEKWSLRPRKESQAKELETRGRE
ncbi:hypothetical protein Y1Q_0009386 [Alligator mississippiensis]|uniref:Uncharacterized protein n=1 Tax=Alligator mississippiensis TaxID=8496 RepID=A0A151N7K0_ALLMI|nr:hypothetical protein Y1Q_0009386 [Alligator mississippiensis]